MFAPASSPTQAGDIEIESLAGMTISINMT
jgi:hypothetical protein